MPPTDEKDSLAESIREEGGEDETEETESSPEETEETEPEEGAEPEEPTEGEDEPDEPEEPKEDEPPSASRGSKRIEALAAERRKLREENEALKREIQTRTATPPPDPAIAQRHRREALARDFADFELLTPEQRAERIERTVETGVRNMVQPLAARFFDDSDRTSFKDAYGPGTSTAKVYARYKDEVERQVADARSKGYNLNRETVLTALVGKSTLKGAKEALDTARKGAKTRLNKATGGSPAGRGDAAGKAGKTRLQDLEDKLKDVPI